MKKPKKGGEFQETMAVIRIPDLSALAGLASASKKGAPKTHGDKKGSGKKKGGGWHRTERSSAEYRRDGISDFASELANKNQRKKMAGERKTVDTPTPSDRRAATG